MSTALLAQVTYETSNFYVSPFAGIVGFVSLVLTIIVIVDVVRRPDWVWQQTGQNKTLWLILGIVGICCAGWIIFLIYWFAIRPKLEAAQQGAGPSGGTGYA